MYLSSELRGTEKASVEMRKGRFVVVCMGLLPEQEWYHGREYFLHRNGRWGGYPVSDEGDTGYYASAEEAEAALLCVGRGAPIAHVEGNVHFLNENSWSACVRIAKQMRK